MSFQLSDHAADIYETTLVPLWFGPWAKEMLMLLPLSSGDAVLDVACGTGVTTRLARASVGPHGRVVGLDINAAMLNKAAQLAPDTGIEWMEGDVTGIALPSQSFDYVLSQHGLHYFPDKPGAMAEFLRLLRPGGTIAMSIWDGHSPYTEALCAAVARHISSDVADKQRSQRITPSSSELIKAFSDAGFREVRVDRQVLDIKVPDAETFVPLHLASMPIAEAFHALDDTRKNTLIADVGSAMQDYVLGQNLVYPDVVNVVVGTK